MPGERADFRFRIQWIAHLGRLHLFHKALLEFLAHLVDDDEALCRDTALPRVDQPALGANRRSEIEIGVFQHEIGIASAELEHALLQHRPRLARHFAPRWTAPGKGHGAYERVLDDRLDLPAADHQRSK